MKNKPLQYHTVKPILRSALERIMKIDDFRPFRLVGGTSLSLRYGHRKSDDIDLFSGETYGSIDFHHLQDILRDMFPYCYGDCGQITGMGASYFVGNSKDDCVKLDLYYTDPFIGQIELYDNIRLAAVDDVIAMKVDVLTRNGRKKDFWDLHALHQDYSIPQMIKLYQQRYPYGTTAEECIKGFSNFELADSEPDPVCNLQKIWQIIKLDFIDWIDAI